MPLRKQSSRRTPTAKGISRISSAFSPSARRGALATLRKSHVGLRPTHFFVYMPLRKQSSRGAPTGRGISRISSAFSLPPAAEALATLRKSLRVATYQKITLIWPRNPPLRENPLEKAAAGIAAFCCGTERPSCCSDDLLETKKSDRQKFVAAAAFGSRRERDSNPRYSYPYTAFRVRPDRPLRHLSNMFGLFQSIYLSASAFPVHPNPTVSRTISRALGLTVCKDKNFYFMLEHVGGLFLILIPKMARILSFAR